MRHLYVFTTFLLSFVAICTAQQDISGLSPFSASPDALKKAFDPVKPGSDSATVLYEEARFDYDAAGLRTLHHRTIVKIWNRNGADEWSTLSSTWAPWEEDRPVLRARIISPDGAVREIDPKTVADTPVKNDDGDILSDKHTLRAPLPAVEPGSIIEEETIEHQTRLTINTGGIEYFYFGNDVAVQRTHVEIRGPQSIPFRYKKFLLPEAVVQDKTENGSRQIVIDQGPMKAVESAPELLPSDEPRSPHIIFSTGKDWNSVAAAYASVVDTQLRGFNASDYLPKFEAAAARDEKIRLIVQKLNKEIRYTGIEFAESTLIPHSPAEVIEHKFGDCKDKATLAVGMLRAAGIPAYVSMLLSSRGVDIQPDLPGLGVFNHAIVYVPGTPDIWLDLTDPDLRLHVISPENQGRYALIARTETTALMRTPETGPEENRVIETREFRIPELGRAHITETNEAWGTRDREYRGQFGYKDEKALRDNLKDYIEYSYGKAKIVSITGSDAEDLTKPYTLRVELDDAQRGIAAQDEAVAAIFPAHVTAELPIFFRQDPKDNDAADKEKSGPRTQDFSIPFAWSHEYRYRIVLPKGFRVRQLPSDTDEQWGPGRLTTSYRKESDTEATAIIRFTVTKRRFTAQEGLALRDGILKVQARQAVMIHFDQIGEADLTEGDIRGAIREFTVLREAHPNEALHSLQMARAYLAAGAGEAARAEGKRAVEREPNSARAWVQLAQIYKDDLVGRPMEKGFDPDAAAAAYRKALDIDSSDDETRANLAILLEYNSAGIHYGPGAHLEESAKEYEKILPKLGKLGIEKNYPILLLRMGRIREMREFLGGKSEDDTYLTLRVCAVAILDGTPAAIAQAPGGSTRQQILASAGQTLLAVRRYKLAADIFEAAIAGAPNPAAVTNLVRILRQSTPVENIAIGPEPEDAVRTLFFRLMRLDEHTADWTEPLSHLLIENSNVEALKLFQFGVRQQMAKMAPGFSIDVAFDIFNNSVQYTRSGNAESGYVLRLVLPGATADNQDLSFFIEKENGAWRVLAAFNEFGGVARRVLALADEGNLKLARTWLDRVRKEVHAGGGDDVLSGPPFARLWEQGEEGSAEQIRVAAVSLLADEPTAWNLALPILDKAVHSGTASSSEFATLALAQAYISGKDPKSAAVTEQLLKAHPRSETALTLGLEGAYISGGKKAADHFLELNMPRFDQDFEALRAVASMAMVYDDTDRSIALTQSMIDAGQARSEDFNRIAWASLMAGKVTSKTLELSNRGILLSGNQATGLLHTLAAVDAELAREGEARQTILQRMKALGSLEPDDDDWYVFGRIAEQFGLNDAAKSMYSKLERPKNDLYIPVSSYGLAQRRLRALTSPKQ
jgi:transglutaminase-like putative cysteine protease/tetratricopeptide (TPR) repeat protein